MSAELRCQCIGGVRGHSSVVPCEYPATAEDLLCDGCRKSGGRARAPERAERRPARR